MRLSAGRPRAPLPTNGPGFETENSCYDAVAIRIIKAGDVGSLSGMMGPVGGPGCRRCSVTQRYPAGHGEHRRTAEEQAASPAEPRPDDRPRGAGGGAGGSDRAGRGRRRDRHRRRSPRPGPQRGSGHSDGAASPLDPARAALQERRHGQIRGPGLVRFVRRVTTGDRLAERLETSTTAK